MARLTNPSNGAVMDVPDSMVDTWVGKGWTNSQTPLGNGMSISGGSAAPAAVAAATSDGKPVRPDYASIIDPATGLIKSQYQVNPGEKLSPYADELANGINLNTDALQELRNRSKETGPSKYTTIALGKQGEEEAMQRDLAQRRGQTAKAGTWEQLAMRGGLSGGERERIGYQGNRDIANEQAGVASQGVQSRYGIGLQDEATKLGILNELPGMELNALQPDITKATLRGKAYERDINRLNSTNELNLGRSIQDIQGKNAFDLGAYDEAMKGWAANKQADATASAGGGGISHLCTAVHRVKQISDEDWEVLKKMKTVSHSYDEQKSLFYFMGCENLISDMKREGVNFKDYYPFVKTTVAYAKEFGEEFALDFYWDYLLNVLEMYSPELYKIAVVMPVAKEAKHANG